MVAAVRSFNIDMRAKTGSLVGGFDLASKKAAELDRSLFHQIQTFGMSSREADIYKLKLGGASESQVKMLESLSRMRDAQEKQSAAMARGAEIARQFVTPLQRLEAQTREYVDLLRRGAIDQQTFRQAMSQAKTEALAAGRAASGANSSFSGLQQGLAGFGIGVGLGLDSLIQSMRSLAAEGLRLAGNWESSQISFRVMVGDAERATELLNDIQEFSASTPFQFNEIESAAKLLLGMGIAAENIVPTLRMLGDVSAGINAPIGELAFAFGKVASTGRLMTESLNQFDERGVGLSKEIAASLGVAASEVRELASKGELGFEHLTGAFERMTSEGGRFTNLTVELSQSMNGLNSTLQDTVEIGLRDFATGFVQGADAVKVLTAALAALGKATETGALQSLGAFAGKNTGRGLATLLFGQTAGQAIDFAGSLFESATASTQAVGGKEASGNETAKNTAKSVKELEQIKQVLKDSPQVVLTPAGLQ